MGVNIVCHISQDRFPLWNGRNLKRMTERCKRIKFAIRSSGPPASTNCGQYVDHRGPLLSYNPGTGMTEQEQPRYGCVECSWRGNDYTIIDDGTTAGRAVCPACESHLALARSVRRE